MKGEGGRGKGYAPGAKACEKPAKTSLSFDWTASNPFFSRPQSSNLETGVNERQVRRAENGEDSHSSFPLPARPCLSLAPVSQLLVVEEKRKGLRAVYPSPTHPPGVGPPFLHLCSFWLAPGLLQNEKQCLKSRPEKLQLQSRDSWPREPLCCSAVREY